MGSIRKFGQTFYIVEKIVELIDMTAFTGRTAVSQLVMGINSEALVSKPTGGVFVAPAVFAKSVHEHHDPAGITRLPGSKEQFPSVGRLEIVLSPPKILRPHYSTPRIGNPCRLSRHPDLLERYQSAAT
jgi:hypothetical protein